MIGVLPKLRCLNLRGLNILESLYFEEILLRKSKDNWFIFNCGSSRSIVVGYSGKIHELLNMEEVVSQQVPVIRRYTGGGTVIVDENTVFTTFIMNVLNAVFF